ncbi:MOSC N-terminal beta barrel domain-containing protein [Pseudonocardia terrae]|uniref:MOSC N-terminal beta barrel domain-containing protein n=1 Tax=Pseudonocardia terrae TaxID=2905831 RepID=UPI0027E1F6D1|nr:MOSC N-terminal beta barrel domain-containing protein [Pseudonocardia terrae]
MPGHRPHGGPRRPWGLAGDRRWMVTEPDGTFVTARALPRLVLVRPEPDGEGLVLRGPGVAPLAVPVPAGGPLVDVEVWRDRVKATRRRRGGGRVAHLVFGTNLVPDTPGVTIRTGDEAEPLG